MDNPSGRLQQIAGTPPATSNIKKKHAVKTKKNASKSGQGHQARVAIVATGSIEIDGKKQSFNINYDVSITVEQIDYAIRKIAGGIAKAANDVSVNGISGLKRDLRKERKEDLGVSNPISE